MLLCVEPPPFMRLYGYMMTLRCHRILKVAMTRPGIVRTRR